MAAMSAAVTVDVPVMGDVHGPQSATMIGPGTPLAPLWMCDAKAFPVRWPNVSFHLSVLPVSVAVNRPDAPTFVPFGCGRSWPAFMAALNFVVFACDPP